MITSINDHEGCWQLILFHIPEIPLT